MTVGSSYGCESCFYLFDKIHEASSEPPGFVAMALQGVHGHLRGTLVADGDHVHRVVQQGSVCLKERGAALVWVVVPEQGNSRAAKQRGIHDVSQEKLQEPCLSYPVPGRPEDFAVLSPGDHPTSPTVRGGLGS